MGDAIPVSNDWAAVQDHSREHPEFLYVYAVISRRSGGLSIGINLNPDKRCNFDCVYCEVDRLTPPRITRLDLARLRRELEAMVRHVQTGGLGREPKFSDLPAPVTRTIRDIAFSGDGEPTMIAEFSACARIVAEVRQAANLVDTKLVLITDAAGLDKLDVREGLRILDANHGEVWGKLDAGTETYYRAVNRSHVRLERIVKNLTLTARERPIVIQSLFLRMHGQPMPPEELEAYCGRLTTITEAGGRIREVHAYTIARPTPEPFATRLERAGLEGLAATIRSRTGLPTRVFE
jgi:wyosine [tRNA(Phe)-imidazoG37] synthetase (radical SAM superfamily)